MRLPRVIRMYMIRTVLALQLRLLTSVCHWGSLLLIIGPGSYLMFRRGHPVDLLMGVVLGDSSVRLHTLLSSRQIMRLSLIFVLIQLLRSLSLHRLVQVPILQQFKFS